MVIETGWLSLIGLVWPLTMRSAAQELRDRASNRRVIARGLPFELAVAGSSGTCLAFAPRETGLWVVFVMAAVASVGGIVGIVSASRQLAGTTWAERGKRSDDKALASAQRTVGCLPLLVVLATIATVLKRYSTGESAWQPWVVVCGGAIGHLIGVAVIAWSRRLHHHEPAT